ATQLASGIALALLTTAAGLVIAIPSLILYMYLAGKVDSVVMEMDRYAQQVIDLISADGVATRNTPETHSATAKKKAS
ncbi:MAG TPA: MotA/TolQ/ExbB proton channel family protein, partial [Planctomycetaceae bacterium]|nr:MotA/TolQ/ExbB proton channel family protein [Planctomycetaceae bacterium]